MFPFLRKTALTILLTAFATQASAMFIQADWYDPSDPQVGTNRYAYSHNDPVNWSDPYGNVPDNWATEDNPIAYDSSGWTHVRDTSGTETSYYDSRNNTRSSDYQNADGDGASRLGVYSNTFDVNSSGTREYFADSMITGSDNSANDPVGLLGPSYKELTSTATWGSDARSRAEAMLSDPLNYIPQRAIVRAFGDGSTSGSRGPKGPGLTNSQARDLANWNGWKEVKPSGSIIARTKGQSVFTDGKNFYSLDIGSGNGQGAHNGGTSKVFNRTGARLGIADEFGEIFKK